MLMHACLQATDDHVVVETTDTEVWMRTTIPAEVRQPGSVLLRESLLRPVAAVPGEIALAGDGQLVRGASKFRVPAMDIEGWPAQDDGAWKPLDVNATALAAAMASVSHAATDDDMRKALNGIHLADGRVWGSDGVSLGFVRITSSGPSVTIPDRRARQVLAVLGEGARLEVANVREGIAGNLRITRGGEQLSMRLLGAKPIAIQPVVDGFSHLDTPTAVKRSELLAAIKRFLPFANTIGPQPSKALPTIVLESSDGHMTMADRLEESRESLDDAVVEHGPKFRAAVDPRRLIAALGAIDSGVVALHAPRDGAHAAFALWAHHADPRNEAHYVAPYTL
ncbi:hypothetical protein [Pseudoxanthomonas sp. USHLN014]|uniref:hypothetical protein n=1 Tax=Pseudoxanthomonas sp. USHLN014 TaxID=3081297 RepID=UPI00301C620F